MLVTHMTRHLLSFEGLTRILLLIHISYYLQLVVPWNQVNDGTHSHHGKLPNQQIPIDALHLGSLYPTHIISSLQTQTWVIPWILRFCPGTKCLHVISVPIERWVLQIKNPMKWEFRGRNLALMEITHKNALIDSDILLYYSSSIVETCVLS